MTYITIYDPEVNPEGPEGHRDIDLVRHRTEDDETEFLFDLREHFRGRYLDKDAYEAHLRAASPHAADELATEFALLLLTTLEPGWHLDDRTRDWFGERSERSALLAHAVTHPDEWNLVGGGLVNDPHRNRLELVELRERGGRMAIVALDADRGLSGEHVPLRNMAHRLSPGDLFRVLFSMLPAVAEHMTDEPDWDAWGSTEAYYDVVDLVYGPTDAPHRKTLEGWKDGAEGTIDAAVECAKWDPAANLDGWR